MKYFTLLILLLQSHYILSQCSVHLVGNGFIPWCQDSCTGFLEAVGGNAPPYTYLWSTGDTTQSISNLCPGTYTVIRTDSNGCVDTDTGQVQINGTPLDFEIQIIDSFAAPSCTNSGLGFHLTVNFYGGCGGYSYLIDSFQWQIGVPWYCSDTLHNIQVWDACDCTFTRDFLIDTLDLWTPPSAIFEAKSIPFTLAPNPAKDVLQINFSGIAPSIAAIEVFSISGQFVATYPIENRVLDIHDLPSGMYALRIRTHDGRYGYARFVKME